MALHLGGRTPIDYNHSRFPVPGSPFVISAAGQPTARHDFATTLERPLGLGEGGPVGPVTQTTAPGPHR